MWIIYLGTFPLVPTFMHLEQAVLFAESVFALDGQQWVRKPRGNEDEYFGPEILGHQFVIRKVGKFKLDS
jgi:hypothetical protein